jgi:hypothetical protein
MKIKINEDQAQLLLDEEGSFANNFEKLLHILGINHSSKSYDYAKYKFEDEINRNPNAKLIFDILRLVKEYYKHVSKHTNGEPSFRPNMRSYEAIRNKSDHDLQRMKNVWEERVKEYDSTDDENCGTLRNTTIRIQHKSYPAYIELHFDELGKVSKIDNQWDVKLPHWYGMKVCKQEIKKLLSHSEFKDYEVHW